MHCVRFAYRRDSRWHLIARSVCEIIYWAASHGGNVSTCHIHPGAVMPDLNCQWNLTSGAAPMLMGRIQTSGCELHFHDTFTIAFLRHGKASVTVRNQFWQFRRGEAFLGNPYEVHAGISPDSAFDYDVYYPIIDLLTECAGLGWNTDRQPRFRSSFLRDPVLVQQLAEALSGTRLPGGAREELPSERVTTSEEGLRRFLHRNRQL